MKALIVILLCVVSSVIFAQTDSLFVGKTDGTLRAFPISLINEISCSGIPASVKDAELMQTVLASFALYQNYPNPFNPTTTIQYIIPRNGEVSIGVYDIQGRLVRLLAAMTQQAGTHSIVWYALNDGGAAVSSGEYFSRIDFNHSVPVKKLILLK